MENENTIFNILFMGLLFFAVIGVGFIILCFFGTIEFVHHDQYSYTKAVCIDAECLLIQDAIIVCDNGRLVNIDLIGTSIPKPQGVNIIPITCVR